VRDADRAPSLLEILKRYGWHERAACHGEEDGRTFFPEPQSRRSDAASPVMLLPLLFCLRCPVRRECLEDAYRPTAFQHGTYERAISGEVERNWRSLPDTRVVSPTSRADARGIWGGTTDLERYEVRKLPTTEAIEYLDDRVEARIERRIRTYLEGRPNHGPRRILGADRHDPRADGSDGRSKVPEGGLSLRPSEVKRRTAAREQC
jgi:hypothetical protein